MHDARRGSTAATYLKAVRGSGKLTMGSRRSSKASSSRTAPHQACVSAGRTASCTGSPRERRSSSATGGIGSPKVLQLSGIGPAAHLAQLDIPVVRDLPGVGENFQDHITTSVYGRTRKPVSLLGADKGLRAVRHGLEYLLTRNGLSSNVIESGGFIDTSGLGRPDVADLRDAHAGRRRGSRAASRARHHHQSLHPAPDIAGHSQAEEPGPAGCGGPESQQSFHKRRH